MKKQRRRHPDKPRRKPRAAKVVKLQRDGQYCAVTPPIEQLDRRFNTVWHVRAPNSEDVPQLTPIPHPLVFSQRDSCGTRYWQCYAGLEPILQEFLKSAGYQIKLTGKRPKKLPAPSTTSLPKFRTVDLEMLNLVRRHDRGIIRYDGQSVHPANLIAQIALAWKHSRIVVAVNQIHKASLLREQLRPWLPNVALFTGRKNPRHATRVTIATPSHLRVGAIGLERRSMLIVTDPVNFFTDFGADALRHAWQARVFGLLRERVEMPPHIRGLMISLFGVREVVIPRHGYARRPVTAVFEKIAGGRSVPIHSKQLQVKQLGIWKHELRNRRIAQIFKAIADCDRQQIIDKFPDLADIPALKEAGRVVLVVENIEQALAMAKRLPNTPVLTDSTRLWDEGLTAEQRRLLEVGRAEANSSPVLIVTVAAVASAGEFDVLVRADAGVGKLSLTRQQRMAPAGAAKPLTVIDFADKHHPLLRRWSRQRKEAYREQGWLIHGERVPTDLERFVAALPEVTS